MRRLPLVGLLVLSLLPTARAADQMVLGSTLVVKNPSTAEKRKITVKAKEAGSDNTLVGDPVANGATVTISVDGAMPSTETYALPTGTAPSTGKSFWSGDAVNGFKYKDPKGDAGPVKSAQIKLKGDVFQIKVSVSGKLAPVGVVPPDPGSAGCAFLTINGGDSYSVAFATGQVTNKGATLFKVTKPTSEGSCAPPPTTTTTLPPIPFRTPPGPAPLRYRDAVFPTVTKTSDVIYGSAVNLSGQTVTLRLDVYEPTGDTITMRPAIVWVHGGGFSGGDKSSAELVDEANTFAMKGYLNVSINYRLESGGCFPPTGTCIAAIGEAQADAQTAVRFLRTNAATYRVDVTRIAMGGSSAGAITALNVGFASSDDPTAAIAAAVSLSGTKILGGTIDNPGDAPSLLFHGTADNIVPYAAAVSTFNQATAAGLDSFLTSWVNAGHVPYLAHRNEILDQTRNFLYWEMDLTNAAQ